ncbi:hypothetical protein [Paraburkholderia caribensis]|uniref:hypothetical protein n=1 Tax=Paraburkholderia caribensis TaxID=75105 RepID=UPI000AE63EC5|nr:hypothetical protein [Paraburkholderia caribensis]
MNNRKMIAGLIGAGRAALLGVSVWGVCACAMGMPQGYVAEIDVHAANYTNDYIQ